MCAIVDTNVYHEVFSTGSQSDAGRLFYDWLMKRNGGTLVSGGEHLRELNRIADFKRVFAERLQAGVVQGASLMKSWTQRPIQFAPTVSVVLTTNTFSRWPESVVRDCSSLTTVISRTTFGIRRSLGAPEVECTQRDSLGMSAVRTGDFFGGATFATDNIDRAPKPYTERVDRLSTSRL